MKKFRMRYLLIILFVLLVVFLGYDSFYRVSYSRKTLGIYSLMMPKSYEIEFIYDETLIYHDDIIDSSAGVFHMGYQYAKDNANKYSFYEGSINIIDEYDDGKIYKVLKKVTYYDVNLVDYVVSYVYSVSADEVFVLSYECKDEATARKLMNVFDRVVKSVSLY